jgi:hypothetical protein
VAAAALAVVGAATLGAQALGSDKGDAQESGGRSPDTTEADDAAATPATTEAPGTTEAPPPACPSDSGRCASITGIRLEGDHYEADYSVVSFDPITPDHGGTADDHHVHFFFDTTPPEQAGTNSEIRGPWVVWDRSDGDGALLFDEATVAGAQEAGASQLCVLVADASHGVEQGTGNCVDLPT